MHKFHFIGHRGCRGEYPENTINGFIKTFQYPSVTGIELDIVCNTEHKIIVSHEPYFNSEICTKPPELPDNFYALPYETIRKVDCGLKIHPRFPSQTKTSEYKPLLTEVFSQLEPLLSSKNAFVYDIEIKSEEKEYDRSQPLPKEMVALIYKEVKAYQGKATIWIRSFDPNILNEWYKIDPNTPLILIEENEDDLETNLNRLLFKPFAYSPMFSKIDQKMIDDCHHKDIKVLAWTVNEIGTMEQLRAWQIDGIITDYPSLFEKLL